MKSIDNQGTVATGKKYIFFSDPDNDINHTETHASFDQRPDLRIQHVDQLNPSVPMFQLCLKNVQNVSSHYPLQPCPFTFLTAVKHKSMPDDESESLRAKSTPVSMKKFTAASALANVAQEVQNQGETGGMDFVMPLKVPDVKICPKTLDKSCRDNGTSKECIGCQRAKCSEKAQAQRKLDFSLSEQQLLISDAGNEPLRSPNNSVVVGACKKKEHVRDISREKENRYKRMKKDDSAGLRTEDSLQDAFKRSRSPRHFSRRENADGSCSTAAGKAKHLAVCYVPRGNDSVSGKPRGKNFATSTAKKDSDKKRRAFGAQHTRPTRDSHAEPSNKNFISDIVDECTATSATQVTFDDNSEDFSTSDVEHKRSKNDPSFLLQLLGDPNRACVMERRRSRYQSKFPYYEEERPVCASSRPQLKKISDRLKNCALEYETEQRYPNHEIPINADNIFDSNLVTKDRNSSCDSVASHSTQRNVSEMSVHHFQDAHSTKSSNDAENSGKDQPNVGDVTSEQSIANGDSQDLDDNSLPEALLDPTKISFRDVAYKPEEFATLLTPDVNLMFRAKRRKQIIDRNNLEVDGTGLLCRSCAPETHDAQEEGARLLHPTALHMQFQAELHLLDSFDESLRQVTNVEKSLCSVKQQERSEMPRKQSLRNDEAIDRSKVTKDCTKGRVLERKVDNVTGESLDDAGEQSGTRDDIARDLEGAVVKPCKSTVRVAEVQTQTVNDIGTQTDVDARGSLVSRRFEQVRGITYRRGSLMEDQAQQQQHQQQHRHHQPSIESIDQYEENMDPMEEVSLPSKMRTMSEISLHETTSSIKTETGTEISISTRDLTCSFNRYLDLEIAQLIKDEKQRYDKIEMLFKSREKTLHDRTKKLVKLEEQKRALRDTGQDSRISSVKKKQRALLLKLQQEKDEMNRLKELHKIASQERKVMLQKQRNMFNPQMSTKNILTKLKRSADNQSPRRLSGPMKGYDIRSNSSMSSLVDSDKSQQDRSQRGGDAQRSPHGKRDDLLSKDREEFPQGESLAMCELKSRKFEEKMPKADGAKVKSQRNDFDSKWSSVDSGGLFCLRRGDTVDVSRLPHEDALQGASDDIKSESGTPVNVSPRLSKLPDRQDGHPRTGGAAPRDGSEGLTRKAKSSECLNEPFDTDGKDCLRADREGTMRREVSAERVQHGTDCKAVSKRKVYKCQKVPKTQTTLNDPTDCVSTSFNEFDLSESQSSLRALLMHSSAVQRRNSKLLRDIAYDRISTELPDSNDAAKELKSREHTRPRSNRNNAHPTNNLPIGSRVNAFTLPQSSSADSQGGLSKSIVIREHLPDYANTKKFKQVLSAREAALVSRKNCVEEWMAWHARLSEEESRVAKMEEAALKLVNASSDVCAYQDTTVSSDTSDVEGRIELLAEKLAERRMEMSRLKKEARKRAKQRLRALETNLLNQIKKYDTTIHEMRKKLEARRGHGKDSDKLAIECRSLADFKIPDIPTRRIQEICGSSDLLRSKSESDLLSTGTRKKDGAKNSVTYEVDFQESRSTTTGTRTNGPSRRLMPEQTLSRKNVDAPETVASYRDASIEKDVSSGAAAIEDDVREGSAKEEVQIVPSLSPSADHRNKLNRTLMARSEMIASNVSEGAVCDSATAPSTTSRESETFHTDGHSTSSSATSLSQIESSNVSQTGNILMEGMKVVERADSGMRVLSENMNFLQLNNKNLKEDIASLENELNVLSKMLRSSKSTGNERKNTGGGGGGGGDGDDGGNGTISSENKDTSKVISETSLKVDTIDSSGDFAEDARNSESTGIKFPHERVGDNSDNAHMLLRIDDDADDCKTVEEEYVSVISEVMSARVCNQEMDYKARSKEILNEIEKSIISEHIKSPQRDTTVESSTRTTHTVSEAASDVLAVLSEVDSEPISQSGSQSRSGNCTKGLNARVSETFRNFNCSQATCFEVLGETADPCPGIPANVVCEPPMDGGYAETWSACASHSGTEDNKDEMPFSEVIRTVDIGFTKESFESETSKDGVGGSVVEGNSVYEEPSLTASDTASSSPKGTLAVNDDVAGTDGSCGSDSNSSEGRMNDGSHEQNMTNLQAEGNNDFRDVAHRMVELMTFTDSTRRVCRSDEPAFAFTINEIPSTDDTTYNDGKLSDAIPGCRSRIRAVKETQVSRVENEITVEDRAAGGIGEQEATDLVPECTERLDADADLDGTARETMGASLLAAVEKATDSSTVSSASIGELSLLAALENPINSTGEQGPVYEDISEASFQDYEMPGTNDSQKTDDSQGSLQDKYQVNTSKSEEDSRMPDNLPKESQDVSAGQTTSTCDGKLPITAPHRDVRHDDDEPSDSSPTDHCLGRSTLSKVDDQLDSECARELLGRLPTAVEPSADECVTGVAKDEQEARKGTVRSEWSGPSGGEVDRSVAGDRGEENENENKKEKENEDENENSRLDIETLDDDLLSVENAESESADVKADASEKDIEIMIDKLKASLEQPGLEVAEFEAKLLRIKQLEIELEIKRLEAEQVSYYVREIPNKPPPPYTPPGGGDRLSTSVDVLCPPAAAVASTAVTATAAAAAAAAAATATATATATVAANATATATAAAAAAAVAAAVAAAATATATVIPTNVDELTAFTEKATTIIYRAKQAGIDIVEMEAPKEIYDERISDKRSGETAWKTRRIYDTFLFDLCKEIVVEIYRSEYEEPGPSWTKPNVKTKPAIKIPRSLEELIEYVAKEVATLFGFKTKLQRENMVMRWSRKRRDRVDELLAREAQAEEDEWTKFHYDELAVKNGLTVAILDSLITETSNVVTMAHAKKRKTFV